MKKMMLSAVAAMAFCSTNAQVKKTMSVPPKPKMTASVLKNATDSISYAVGMSVASSMQQSGVEKLNSALFAKAINDVYNKSKTIFTPEEASMTIQNKLQEYARVKSEAQKAEGQNFLALNKRRSNIIALPNGLQYEIIKAGDANGPKPKAVDTVVVDYVGTLTNGTEFDNSVKRGQPATFPLNGVIRGWTEILQLMPKGSHWKVYIPSELGYGQHPPQGAPIPPNAVLIFEITLIDIKPAVPAQSK